MLFYFEKTYVQRKLTNAFTLEWLVKNAIYSHGCAGFTHHACNLLQVVNLILFELLYQVFNISKLDSSGTNILTFMQGKISSCRISLRILGKHLKVTKIQIFRAKMRTLFSWFSRVFPKFLIWQYEQKQDMHMLCSD